MPSPYSEATTVRDTYFQYPKRVIYFFEMACQKRGKSYQSYLVTEWLLNRLELSVTFSVSSLFNT